MARPVFADPKTDFAFKKIFGRKAHKRTLIAFLNHLLELDAPHAIADVELLSPEQRPEIAGMKSSIVDVKCIDTQGTRYVVEMQVLPVEGFDKRVVYNVSKAYTNQLDAGAKYPSLDDVIGVTICDFEMWPREGSPSIPMLSRWRMTEQHSGELGLGQIQFVFLELPKLAVECPPESPVEKWAYFFREAENLTVVPEILSEGPFAEALELARTAGFTEAEWEDYIRAGMAIQDERGALSLAERRGLERGREEGLERGRRETLEETLLMLMQAKFQAVPEPVHRRIQAAPPEDLRLWTGRVLTADRAEAIFEDPSGAD